MDPIKATNSEKKSHCVENFFGLDRKFVRTIDFKDLTKKWFDSNKLDHDFKILRLRKCPDLDAVSKLFYSLYIDKAVSLFVFVLSPIRYFENLKSNHFYGLLEVSRPILLQIRTTTNESHIYVKEYKGMVLTKLSNTPEEKDILKLMLSSGQSTGDIYKVEEFKKDFESELRRTAPTSVALLRFMSLFIGKCERHLSWLTSEMVLNSNNLKAYLAFIDYPFEVKTSVNLAWKQERYDLVEIFISGDSPFPKDFDFNRMLPHASDEFRKHLQQRRDLHRSIAEQNIEEVSKILDEMLKFRKLKRIFKENNESALATALKSGSVKLYRILLRNGLYFCKKCEGILIALPQETREEIFSVNCSLFPESELKAGDHPIMRKCWLGLGHSNVKNYSAIIRGFIRKLESVSETKQLLALAARRSGTSLVFDFKNDYARVMCTKITFLCNGLCGDNGFIVVCAKNAFAESYVCGLIAHELTHNVMQMIYGSSKPFLATDVERRSEMEIVISDCREIEKKEACIQNRLLESPFKFYDEARLAGEIIAYVPQLLIEHAERPEKVEVKYKKLYDYYFNYVVKDIELALKADEKDVGNYDLEKLNRCKNSDSSHETSKKLKVYPVDCLDELKNAKKHEEDEKSKEDAGLVKKDKVKSIEEAQNAD